VGAAINITDAGTSKQIVDAETVFTMGLSSLVDGVVGA
jgi:hypothetical protein